MAEVQHKRAEPSYLTFDCPWCGAISRAEETMLGEHYVCPECHRGTKLTEVNTRHRDLTEAPPDAPHHAEPASSTSRLPLALGLLLLAGGAAWFLFGRGGGSGDASPAPTTTADRAADRVPVEKGATPSGEPRPAPEPTPSSTGAPAPSTAPPPPPPPDAEARVAAKARLEEATLARDRARAHHEGVQARWEAWRSEQPRVAAALEDQAGVNALLAEVRRRHQAAPPTSPAAARSFNEGVRAFVAADEARTRVATRVLERVRAAPGAPPLSAATWEGLNFVHLEAALLAWLPELDLLAAQVPGDLRRDLAEAERRLADAEAAWKKAAE
jgi:hypothetical protein